MIESAINTMSDIHAAFLLMKWSLVGLCIVIAVIAIAVRAMIK